MGQPKYKLYSSFVRMTAPNSSHNWSSYEAAIYYYSNSANKNHAWKADYTFVTFKCNDNTLQFTEASFITTEISL